MTDTVEVSGRFTALSAGDPRVMLVTGEDGTMVPVRFAEGLVLPLASATVELRVPADFEPGDDAGELFAALALLTEASGEPVEAISVTRR